MEREAERKRLRIEKSKEVIGTLKGVKKCR